MAEAEIVARLQHPNIVQIHAIGDFEGRPYVELEYVEAGSLGRAWTGRPGRPARPRGWSRAWLRHGRGTPDGDRPPRPEAGQHPVSTDDGTPKITDFGLAKSIEKDSDLTRTRVDPRLAQLHGSGAGRGPCQGRRPAADVYALGANLYELLTGRPPFLVGPTVLATLDLVKNAEPVPPRHLQPGVDVGPGDHLPEVPAEGAAAAIRVGRGTGRGSRPLPRRRADPGAADAVMGARLEVGLPPPGDGRTGLRQHPVDPGGGRGRPLVPSRPGPSARGGPRACRRGPDPGSTGSSCSARRRSAARIGTAPRPRWAAPWP